LRTGTLTINPFSYKGPDHNPSICIFSPDSGDRPASRTPGGNDRPVSRTPGGGDRPVSRTPGGGDRPVSWTPGGIQYAALFGAGLYARPPPLNLKLHSCCWWRWKEGAFMMFETKNHENRTKTVCLAKVLV
jgi:hypothetical protein